MAEHNVGVVKHLLHLHGPVGTPPNIVSCNKGNCQTASGLSITCHLQLLKHGPGNGASNFSSSCNRHENTTPSAADCSTQLMYVNTHRFSVHQMPRQRSTATTAKGAITGILRVHEVT